MSIVNVDKLQSWIDAGRIDPTQPITPRELIKSKLVHSVRDGIKLLGGGSTPRDVAANGEMRSLRQPIDIIVSRASASAIAAVEAAGGKITTRYFTKDSMRRLVRGEAEISWTPLPVGPEYVEAELGKRRGRPHMYRLPDPTSRRDVEYYRDPAHRGYLSHSLKPGESPSLFHKVPGQEDPIRARIEAEKKRKQEEKQREMKDRLW